VEGTVPYLKVGGDYGSIVEKSGEETTGLRHRRLVTAPHQLSEQQVSQ
jgi:hypothetical protein